MLLVLLAEINLHAENYENYEKKIDPVYSE